MSIPVASATTATPTNEKGEFVRKESIFRSWIKEGGEFAPEINRYHLYVSLACPWAHRTLIVRALKGLEDVITVSVVHYLMKPHGWEFADPADDVQGCTPDTVNNCKLLREVYLISDPEYSGRVTVPILFDRKTKKIVNNESAEIVRMFNSAFNKLCKNPDLDLYPSDLTGRIDELNNLMYEGLNNGVYKAGFATSQEAYETNARLVRDTLFKFEDVINENKSGFLVGDRLTETDVRLFTTLIRFDPVYVGHFKCNLITVKELPNLSKWLKRIYELPGVKASVSMEHIKKHYYMSHKQINPTGIVPLYNGPLVGDE